MPKDVFARLRATSQKLPTRLRDEILAIGPAAVPRLIALLEADDWAAVHAVDLLVDLRAVEAIGPMLDVLSDVDSDDYLWNRVVIRLPELGAAALEPTLDRLSAADDDGAGALCEILANLGIKDERILDALTRRFLEQEDFWAGLLATYGDPRALPLVEDALEAFEPDFSSLMSRVDLNELLDAHERLGGVLSPDLREEFDGWHEEWNARFSPAPPTARTSKVGRNEPCPCGSGKKYKKCCLDARERSPAPSVVTRDGDRILTSGDVSAEALEVARRFFAEQDAGRGPTKQIVDFARPLLDSTDGTAREMQSMLTLSMALWNAAVMNVDEREKELTRLASKFEGEMHQEFWQLTRMMMERHRTMFPDLHGTRAT